ncbi:MAG: PASTA domain-containing protein [Acidimicrobiia bacterium]|nr:PASTA domain-containing protein [Acidimicrobiia bacterium]
MAGVVTADLVGRVLAGRYRLLAAIGSGASGRVYVADDIRLRRRVAVKVLHAALADDAGFLRRFRSEAQLAASLHHPNVMAVYDWGEDGVPFMVLELLAGGSVRGMLDRGTRLTPAQAAHVGGQVAGALEYAHSRGLVHRDIKPANLLFDEHGIVRVADFGLARALAEASWTEPAGTVLGTARYAAPEQATGAALDGRADIYALGLVLVEMVTGTVPLVGDSPMGTLGLRQESAVEVPSELGPLTPVVERACSADPAARYPTADGMKQEIADAAETLPPPGPLALAGLGEVTDDPHPTQVVNTALAPPLFDQDEPVRPAGPRPGRPMSSVRLPQRSRSTAPFVLGAVVIVAMAAVAFVLARPASGPSAPVPLLIGKTEAQIQSIAFDNKFLVTPEFRRSDDPKGFVIEQDPAPGAFLAEGESIRVVVSRGPKPVAIPDLRGKTEADARAALEPQFVVVVEPHPDETVPKDQIIQTVPAGTAQPDTEIVLWVSTGPKPRVVPNVVGKTYDEAVNILKAGQLGAARFEEFSETVLAGKVIRTEPGTGAEAARDSAVKVVVSKGRDLVTVPNFVGKTIAQITVLAEQAGVEIETRGVVKGKARAQAPTAGGEPVPRGTVVTIYFS